MEIALAVWLILGSFLTGAHLATSGKIKVTSVKAELPKTSYLRPCIGAHDTNCDERK